MHIFLLVSLDQILKIIISMFFKNTEFYILDKFLGFKVVLNSEHSSVFNGEFLNLNISMNILIILSIFNCLFLISLYKYLKYINIKTKSVYTGIILFISAGIATTIDRIFWGGSLDYMVFSRYILDLKDIYLVIGSFVAIIIVFKNLDLKANSKKDLLFIKDYFAFLRKGLTH